MKAGERYSGGEEKTAESRRLQPRGHEQTTKMPETLMYATNEILAKPLMTRPVGRVFEGNR